MTTFIEAMPKEMSMFDGEIFYLTPSWENNGIYLDGYTRVAWFKNMFPEIADAELPLKRELYDQLKAIGECWLMNAAQWRKNDIIQVEGLTAEDKLDDEEVLLDIMNQQRNPNPEPEELEEPIEETPVEEQPVEQPTEEEVPTEEV
ncbi:hypothetical protein Slash_43 [Bacillus phage Slash]|uniref:Uncharacterized protein n=2 Tax=Slashvirus TaxID=1921709 RepID=U5PY58_9CAUD|nr:hypothetical protein Staley_43 [Bacillus phage Staley]YP_008771945.1 hypothetical protein Slash_43 [Bacillus phage Slash]AGY48332.1 hypothetical protein Slash_43 [Bacillus phage Slash]AGY48726.1 hypothetical protein Staley_43 [Bacillus phage Staley]